MCILVFGARGQLASSLRNRSAGREATFLDRAACDLLVPSNIEQALDRYQPELIINAAAYTQVDKAEEESETAYQINAGAPEKMALWARENDARLLHVSTDFVFDGLSDEPYKPEDATHPLGVYASSKLLGENVALGFTSAKAMIIRTSWVYSEHGNNFVKTMLRLMSEKDEISVVSDQRGSPTYAGCLAETIWQLVDQDLFSPGIFHWTDEGDITWHEFAVAIQEEALELGLLIKAIPIRAITTAEYPTPAERPKYSVLDNSKLAGVLGRNPTPWRENLRRMLARLNQ